MTLLDKIYVNVGMLEAGSEMDTLRKKNRFQRKQTCHANDKELNGLRL